MKRANTLFIMIPHQLPEEGALHEAVEEMLELPLGLPLLGAQRFDFLDQRGECLLLGKMAKLC